MPLPTDVNDSPNYTPAQHADHHNEIHTFVNAGGGGGGSGTGFTETSPDVWAFVPDDGSVAIVGLGAANDGAVGLQGGGNVSLLTSGDASTITIQAQGIGSNVSIEASGTFIVNATSFLELYSDDSIYMEAGTTLTLDDSGGAAVTLDDIRGAISGGGITGVGTGTDSVKVGPDAVASANQSIAIGDGTNATASPQSTAQGAVAIGGSDGAAVNGARASGATSVALGSGNASVAGALASGAEAVAIGTGTTVNVTRGVAIGYGSQAIATSGTALGSFANVFTGHTNSTAVGQNATTTAANQIMLGTSSETVYVPGILQAPVSANRQTGNYTLVLADHGKAVEMNVAGANTLTVPPNSSVAFPIGTVIEGVQWGAGQTTITPGVGVTIRSSGGKLKTAAQYASFSLRKVAADEWHATGELSA